METLLCFVTEHLVIYIQYLTTILTDWSTLHIESDILTLLSIQLVHSRSEPGQKCKWP